MMEWSEFDIVEIYFELPINSQVIIGILLAGYVFKVFSREAAPDLDWLRPEEIEEGEE